MNNVRTILLILTGVSLATLLPLSLSGQQPANPVPLPTPSNTAPPESIATPRTITPPPTTTITPGDDEPVPNLLFPGSPVEEVINKYEFLTGKRVIRDATLAQGVNIKIQVMTPIKKSEAIRLIEATLLLNGIAFTPGPDNTIKALNVIGGGKNPRSEGVPVYASLSSLPPGDQIVSYFMSLRYISAAEAATVFQQQVALHPPYGVVVPVPNAQALIITESTSAVRQLVKIQKLIDVPPAKVVSEFVTLLRADAEKVADVLTKMLEARRNNQTALGQPPAPSPEFADDSGPNERNIVAGTVQLIPDARTNRILVVTRPINFSYIKGLIQQFDEAATIAVPFERPLRYVAAADVLPVLQKALAETKEDAQGTTGQAGQNNQNRQTNNRNSNSSSGSSVVDDIQSPTADTTPESVIVGKTKIIADNRANSILVIGPPESIARAAELLTKLDSAPRQVYLATVIGELTLNDDSEFGIDLLQKFKGSNHGNVASQVNNSATTKLDPSSLTTAAVFPATAGLSVYGSIGSTLNYYVNALQTSNRFKILSRPSVYTSNNKKAVISSGQQVPVPGSTQSTVNTGTTNNTVVSANVEYKPVELKIAVVPLINTNKEVTLQIAQKNDTIGATSNIGGNEVPAINTQQFTTSVTVPNRQTVVLGGLIINNANKDISGLPWISNIPVIGLLFKQTSKSTSRREIIILIEPNVIETQEELAAASAYEKNRTVVGDEASKMSADPGVFVPDPNFLNEKKVKKKKDPSSKASTTTISSTTTTTSGPATNP